MNLNFIRELIIVIVYDGDDDGDGDDGVVAMRCLKILYGVCDADYFC